VFGKRGTALLGAFGATAMLALASGATATATPVKVGEPLSDEAPAIAVDSSGTAYIAWADTKNPTAQTTARAGPVLAFCIRTRKETSAV
jgi:hypothetical protein